MSTARECVAKIINENIGGRKLIAINRFVALEKYLEENGINVFAHVYLDGVTSSETQSIISLEQLEGNADKYYVLVSSERDLDRLYELNVLGGGYQLVKDYCTVQEMHRKIGNRTTPYRDTFNNRCNYVPNNVNITFAGTNANIEFGQNLKTPNNLSIIIYNDSNIKIGNYSEVKGEIIIRDNSNLIIGDYSTFAINFSFNLVNGSVKVGNDCMFATNSLIFCGDGHPVYNVNTNQCINESSERNLIEIGNHVWVGTRSIILSKTVIKDGSIVGAGSVVKGVFPNNCVIAGNPAIMKKKDIAWSRAFGDKFNSIESIYYCPTKDNE